MTDAELTLTTLCPVTADPAEGDVNDAMMAVSLDGLPAAIVFAVTVPSAATEAEMGVVVEVAVQVTLFVVRSCVVPLLKVPVATNLRTVADAIGMGSPEVETGLVSTEMDVMVAGVTVSFLVAVMPPKAA